MRIIFRVAMSDSFNALDEIVGMRNSRRRRSKNAHFGWTNVIRNLYNIEISIKLVIEVCFFARAPRRLEILFRRDLSKRRDSANRIYRERSARLAAVC